MNKNDILYGGEGDEDLCHDIDEYVEYTLDGLDIKVEPGCGTIDVFEFRRMKPENKSLPVHVLSFVLESLDDEYGDPNDTGFCEETDGMKKAAEEFVKKVCDEYVTWACETSGVVHKIDIYEWCKENNPDWIDEDE